jgi:hypothetical protein
MCPIMTFPEFNALVEKQPDGVLLLEGRRSIPPAWARQARKIAKLLASHFPELRFRSGNATGSDQAFSEAIAEIDASRLQVMLPYTSHRKNTRHAATQYTSPENLSPEQTSEVTRKTITATPSNKGLVELRMKQTSPRLSQGSAGPIAAKAAYLLRDTMKVVGYPNGFPKPFCALFFVDLSDPMQGGTGHTIRVCQQEGVPCVFQDSWSLWTKVIEASD